MHNELIAIIVIAIIVYFIVEILFITYVDKEENFAAWVYLIVIFWPITFPFLVLMNLIHNRKQISRKLKGTYWQLRARYEEGEDGFD